MNEIAMLINYINATVIAAYSWIEYYNYNKNCVLWRTPKNNIHLKSTLLLSCEKIKLFICIYVASEDELWITETVC